MIISLDTEIQISERVVKDAVTLFGDIGGFSSFFLVLLGLFVGSIPGKLLNMSATASLFRANLSKDENRKKGVVWFDSTRKLEFKKAFTLR